MKGRVISLALLLAGCGQAAPAPVAQVSPEPVARVVEVRKADDADKAGTLRSVLSDVQFHQRARATGPSADRLDFTFDAPAEVVGVLVSADVWDELSLVEVAVGINASTYGGGSDWLIHASSTMGEDIDESIMLPGFQLRAGDRVSAVAWLQNTTEAEQYVSPEIIVYYRWL